ncbi:zinc finger protein 64 isoform X2 [Dunckerocampus dactyliophorus]|uniref:zinc finger protein 64 isoform X2 n=1 Tax=Dunckerocampus dactyliophorus TaxID=161453 RepID=UPI0024056DB4|nr:zinc finger protein 64 isoform X2 [Dunckerocampus dactyliophorus]
MCRQISLTMAAAYDAEGHSVVVEVSPDIHICGFCKQQFNNFQVFVAHKQTGCSLQSMRNSSATTTASPLPGSSMEVVLEETFQTCLLRGVKKILTKPQKSKKLKDSLTSKRHSCCFSGCTFMTQYGQKDMERHLKTHTGEKPFECELCHKRFSRRDKLNMHSRSHTGEKPHKCKLCAYAAADSSSLKKHLRIHYDERPFKCQICPYASRNSSQLTVHLRSHTGDAPFQCQQCDAKFKINSDLKRHVRVHSGEKPYKCDLCEYRCAMKGNLKSHVQIKHAAENSFHCAHCDFKCANKTALRQHSRQHRPVQPVQCPKCTYSCASRGALKVHERIHSEERPFKCDSCGYASKQRSNLVIHRKRFHSDTAEKGGGRGGGKRPGDDPPKPVSSRYRAKLDATRAFSCDLCSASFVREDSLRSHRKQHREVQNPLQGHVGSPLPAVAPQVEVPVQTDSLSQLKIIVSSAENSNKMVLLSPEHQDMVVNSMLLAPGPCQSAEATYVPQTVLLTPLHTTTADDPLQQVQPTVVTHDSAASPQTFITTCTELEDLSALVQEGGTEVTVVTEGNGAVMTTPPSGGVEGRGQCLSM